MTRWCSPGVRAAIIAGAEPEWLVAHPRYRYCKAAILASGPWVRRRDLAPYYRRARELTAQTGRQYVVDHIVPLVHPYVCGLNVPANLRVVPKVVNAAKSNRFAPDQTEAPLRLPAPAQLRLAL